MNATQEDTQKISKAIIFIKSKILDYLSSKPRSEYEVKKKIDYIFEHLNDINLSSDNRNEIESNIIQNLKDSGLINDLHYSQDYVKEKINSRNPHSRYKIKKFLTQKKVPQNFISTAMQEFTDEDEVQIIKNETDKKIKLIKDKNPYIIKMKLKKYLASKGYRYELINTVVDSCLGVK